MTGLIAEWHRMALSAHTAQVELEHSRLVIDTQQRKILELEKALRVKEKGKK